ncbi:Aste57867_25484 [Aphanomyces stellatus]|uniref:Aste57867_25484 protein n=1 Tax=Aphanomyces stellatus TaxID=120398 RepID=A0A485LVQ0_9STRA|nr:hypothetical protein As57867_025405 [Aphanomyces stellatus]VFU02107.1 Aste57867_25484 [Aphanomyces stellatus]
MGNQTSAPIDGAAPGDPCATALQAYLNCVDVKTKESGGLRDGDECEDEIKAYKQCRLDNRKKKPADAAPASMSTA